MFSLLAWLGRGPFARATDSGTCTEPLAHSLVVSILCLSVGVGECNGFMFLPFGFLAPNRLAVSTLSDALPSLLCLCSLRCGCLHLHAPCHFRALTLSLFWWLPPWTCPINSGLRCLVTYLTSPLARQTSISYLHIRNWALELSTVALSQKSWSLSDFYFLSQTLHSVLQEILWFWAPSELARPSGLKIGFKQYNTKPIQMLPITLSGREFDDICEINIFGNWSQQNWCSSISIRWVHVATKAL